VIVFTPTALPYITGRPHSYIYSSLNTTHDSLPFVHLPLEQAQSQLNCQADTPVTITYYTHSTITSLARKNMPEQVPIGIVADSPSLAAPHNHLRILNKESNALFHRAHNTYATVEYTLEMLDE
jgi:hypothetical protein